MTTAELILHSGKVVTLGGPHPIVRALALGDGRVLAAGDRAEAERYRGPATTDVDLGGRTVIPGLNDSHLHLIRGGLNYVMELRWDGVPSLADALRMLAEQARRTPAPQWVRVIGGWSEFQFAERRMPTLAEINAAAPDTPVIVLHLYTRALLNRAALVALGYTRETPDPPRGEIQRDPSGDPTGMLIATPDARILYTAIAGAPKLPVEQQVVSTLHFFRELNRLGITSAIDAGGGFQACPDDYGVVERLAKEDRLTVRIAMNLFTQRPGEELEDFRRWAEMTAPDAGDDMLRVNGVGEMIRYKCYDFENFEQPRPDPLAGGEDELEEALSFLVERRWPFRMHATYHESVPRLPRRDRAHRRARWPERAALVLRPLRDGLGGVDRADRDARRRDRDPGPDGVRRRAVHRSLRPGRGQPDAAHPGDAEPRPARRGRHRRDPGGVVQPVDLALLAGHRADRRGHRAMVGRPPAQSGPGASAVHPRQRLVLRRAGPQGTLTEGALADLAVLSDDYLSIPDEHIKHISSVLTVVGGRVVHGDREFAELAPLPPPAVPDWTPYATSEPYAVPSGAVSACATHPHLPTSLRQRPDDPFAGACFAF
jgi:hypothetical protein